MNAGHAYPPHSAVGVFSDYVPWHWRDRILHDQKAHRIREALVGRPNTVGADVPYGAARPGNGSGRKLADADPGDPPAQPGLSSVDADAEPAKRRFGRRR